MILLTKEKSIRLKKKAYDIRQKIAVFLGRGMALHKRGFFLGRGVLRIETSRVRHHGGGGAGRPVLL